MANGIAFGLGQGEEEMLGGDVVVLEVFGFLAGAVEHFGERVGHAGRVAAVNLGKLGDGRVRASQQLLHAHPDAFEDGQDDAFAVFEQRGEQVHGQHFGVAVFSGGGRSGLHGLLRLDGQFIPLEWHTGTNLRLNLAVDWMPSRKRGCGVAEGLAKEGQGEITPPVACRWGPRGWHS